MKKLINHPEDVVREALEGLAAAHPETLRVNLRPAYVVRADAPLAGKVGVLSGGGSGHEPLHTGYVGRGMLDAACPGPVFTSPTPDQVAEATAAVDVAAGTAKVVSNLPVPLSHESLFILDGTMFMAGGRSGGAVRRQVDVIDPATGALTRAGLLPQPAADMAMGQIGNNVYLFGGESPTPLSSIVHIGMA